MPSLPSAVSASMAMNLSPPHLLAALPLPWWPRRAPLVKLVRPHAAVITGVEPVHLEFFNSVNDIARAKAEIFAGLEPDGAALLNRDNDRFDLLAELARAAGVRRIVGFGEHPQAEA